MKATNRIMLTTKVNFLMGCVIMLISLQVLAQENADEETQELSPAMMEEYEAFEKYADSIDTTFSYEYGMVQLEGGEAILSVPEAFKFLNTEQANRVLVDLWGNPSDPSTLGLLIKKEESPAYISYAVEISYSEEGYIEDGDASEIDYDELLEEMQTDAQTANTERKRLGYPEIEIVGWASKPFYDSENKKLHWAKELKFETSEVNTLNYNVRVLGRRGFMNLNVIGDMDVLEDVQSNIDPILESVEFMPGNQYSDFNPDLDEVAAYGIGGLIAGKVLAKAGFFALILKFWKFIAIGAVALFAAFKKKIFGDKDEPSTKKIVE